MKEKRRQITQRREKEREGGREGGHVTGRKKMREAKRSRKDKAAQNVPLRHLKSFFNVENLSFYKRRRAEK